MIKVSDIMTREVLRVRPETPLKEAAVEMILRGVHGAPVEDASGQVIGVLSTSNLVRGATTLPEPESVSDAMTPVLFAVIDDDPALYAAKRMVETGSHRVLVLDAAGKLVGVVSPMDLLRALVRGQDLLAGAAPAGATAAPRRAGGDASHR